MVFPVVINRCKSWTIKGWMLKNWCCQAVVQRILLRVSWAETESKQLMPKEINPEYLLVGLMLKLKLQYFGHLLLKDYSLEKTLMLEKTEGRKRSQRQRIWLDGITDSMNMNLRKHWQEVKGSESWHAAVHGITRHWTWLRENNNENLSENMKYKSIKLESRYRIMLLLSDMSLENRILGPYIF